MALRTVYMQTDRHDRNYINTASRMVNDVELCVRHSYAMT